PGSRMAFELGVDVFDEDLAADLFAKEADIAANYRTQIDDRRRLARRQCRQQLAQRLGGKQRFVGWNVERRTNLRLGATRRDAIEQTHRWFSESRLTPKGAHHEGHNGHKVFFYKKASYPLCLSWRSSFVNRVGIYAP